MSNKRKYTSAKALRTAVDGYLRSIRMRSVVYAVDSRGEYIRDDDGKKVSAYDDDGNELSQKIFQKMNGNMLLLLSLTITVHFLHRNTLIQLKITSIFRLSVKDSDSTWISFISIRYQSHNKHESSFQIYKHCIDTQKMIVSSQMIGKSR